MLVILTDGSYTQPLSEHETMDTQIIISTTQSTQGTGFLGQAEKYCTLITCSTIIIRV